MCDHSNADEISSLFKTIKKEQGGLDVLVNNCFGAVEDIFTSTEKKFWEKGAGWWDKMNNVGLRAHFIASQYAVPLLMEKATAERPGLIVTLSSFGGSFPIFDVAYGVGKAAKDRMV